MFPLTFWPRICTPQPLGAIFVVCLNCRPFCPVIVVGMFSALVQRLPKAASAECGPIGRLMVMLDTGTSGVEAKLVVVIPFLMSVLPFRITRTPLASSTRSRSGNAAPPCETRYAGPVSFVGSVGVFARAPPTSDLPGQLKGFASNVASEDTLSAASSSARATAWAA